MVENHSILMVKSVNKVDLLEIFSSETHDFQWINLVSVFHPCNFVFRKNKLAQQKKREIRTKEEAFHFSVHIFSVQVSSENILGHSRLPPGLQKVILCLGTRILRRKKQMCLGGTLIPHLEMTQKKLQVHIFEIENYMEISTTKNQK